MLLQIVLPSAYKLRSTNVTYCAQTVTWNITILVMVAVLRVELSQ